MAAGDMYQVDVAGNDDCLEKGLSAVPFWDCLSKGQFMDAASVYADLNADSGHISHMCTRKQGGNLTTARGKVPLLYLAEQEKFKNRENYVCDHFIKIGPRMRNIIHCKAIAKEKKCRPRIVSKMGFYLSKKGKKGL